MSIASALLLAVLGAAACSDDTSEGAWDVDEEWEESQWRSLEGPPGRSYEYLGRVDDRIFFHLDAIDAEVDPVVAYEPGEGWELAPQVAEAYGESRWRLYSEIAQVGSEAFIFDASTEHLYRSDDRGESWEMVGTVDLELRFRYFGTDGDHLYLHSAEGEESRVLSSSDGGESFDEIDVPNGETFEVFDGLIAHDVDGTSRVRFSNDGGESWHERDIGRCAQFHPQMWQRIGSTYVVLDRNEEVFHFDPADVTCEIIDTEDIEGLGSKNPDSPGSNNLAVVGTWDDQIYAFTYDGELGRLSDDLSRFEPVESPPALRRPRYSLSPTGVLPHIFDLGDDGVGVITHRGFFRSTDEGDRWHSASHPYSHVSSIVEHDDELLARGAHGQYRFDSGQWRFQNFDLEDVPGASSTLGSVPGKLFELDGRLLSVMDGPTLIEVDGGTEPSLVWRAFDDHYWSVPTNVSVTASEDTFFMAGYGGRGLGVLPESQAAEEFVSGTMQVRKLYGVDLTTGEATEYTDGHPTLEGDAYDEEQRSGVVSLERHDGVLWATTQTHGVWRIDDDNRQWKEAHDGLPTADHDADYGGVHALDRLDDDNLYALAERAVYRCEDGRWQRLTDDAFAEAIERDGSNTYLHDIVEHRGETLLVASDGLHYFDPETADHEHFWQPPNEAPIRTAVSLDSGLYVGLQAGGLWHFGPSLD